MKRFLRPFILILLSGGLALCAALLVVWPSTDEMQALPLQPGDQEIVWLYTATQASSWGRFVAAANEAVRRLRKEYPDLEIRTDDNTFPQHTTSVPEMALSVRGKKSRLVFRWYKLTSDQKVHQWMETLVGGSRRPPLAVIGGNSSDGAMEIAASLRERTDAYPDQPAPLLILTTATANGIQSREDLSRAILNDFYPGRTFRFCFTNQQMANAVVEFIWSRPTLRPDADPVYIAQWEDDPYSMDLTGRFCEALREPILARAAAREWGWLTGAVAAGAFPLNLAALPSGAFREPVAEAIDFSVGSFDLPNRWEGPAVDRLMDVKIGHYPAQQRPLLVLAAALAEPARRFLCGLVRAAPVEARRFVVAAGDTVSFNAVYRDRKILWPIQDLPFDLVFFRHRNPVDESIDADSERRDGSPPLKTAWRASGTEDLLLYMDIVAALVGASYHGNSMPVDGDELARRLHQARWREDRVVFGEEGSSLFDGDGNRCTGTGEHIVWLRPILEGDRVQPRSKIEVWAWHAREKQERRWERRRVLDADYEESIGDK